MHAIPHTTRQETCLWGDRAFGAVPPRPERSVMSAARRGQDLLRSRCARSAECSEAAAAHRRLWSVHSPDDAAIWSAGAGRGAGRPAGAARRAPPRVTAYSRTRGQRGLITRASRDWADVTIAKHQLYAQAEQEQRGRSITSVSTPISAAGRDLLPQLLRSPGDGGGRIHPPPNEVISCPAWSEDVSRVRQSHLVALPVVDENDAEGHVTVADVATCPEEPPRDMRRSVASRRWIEVSGRSMPAMQLAGRRLSRAVRGEMRPSAMATSRGIARAACGPVRHAHISSAKSGVAGDHAGIRPGARRGQLATGGGWCAARYGSAWGWARSWRGSVSSDRRLGAFLHN